MTVPAELKSGLTRRPLSKKIQKNWALVLESKGIPYRTMQSESGWQLQVPADDYNAACEQLKIYEQENRNWPPPPPQERKLHENTATTLWIFIALVLFHNLAVKGYNPFGSTPLDWTQAGAAQAEKILSGQWWRLFTALTLHSGALHLTGNVVAGMIFCTRLSWILGSGWAWFLILLSGACGNLFNTLIQPPTHSSIGSSTAIFATVGLLATLNMLHFRRSMYRRWPLPLAAALGLLGLLGSGGENTDIGAHLFGFMAGAGIAFPVHLLFVRNASLKQKWNPILAIISFTLLIAAWYFALS